MPGDEQELNRVLDAFPSELMGLRRERSEGKVIYRAEDELSEGDPVVFLEVAEASDVGVRDETNRELLERTGRGVREADYEGKTTVESQTDPSEGVMYIRITDRYGLGITHSLVWATEDGPYLFAANADTEDVLDALINAFAKAARSS